jgi:hypothetical protein
MTWWIALASLVALALAGCGAGPVAAGTSTPTATTWVLPTTAPSPTPWPTSSVKIVSDTVVPCPVTVAGDQKVFADAETGLKFSFPASLTEQNCERMVGSDGSEGLIIGSLFHVGVQPHPAGQTIQAWVNAQTDQYETVTLTPLTVAHAASAVSIQTAPTATPGPRPFDAEPFSGARAIVAGTQRFYTVTGLIAERFVTDASASNSTMNAIIATFEVP